MTRPNLQAFFAGVVQYIIYGFAFGCAFTLGTWVIFNLLLWLSVVGA